MDLKKVTNIIDKFLLFALIISSIAFLGDTTLLWAKDISFEPNFTELDFTLQYDFNIVEKTTELLFRINLPKSLPERQRIISVNCTPKPLRKFSANGNDYAEFWFINPNNKLTINVDIYAQLYDYDLSVALEMQKKPIVRPPDINKYLKSERMIEVDKPAIQKVAISIKGVNQLEIVENIFNFVTDHLEVQKKPELAVGAVRILEKRKGKCADYCDLFIAICRAKKIPARAINGYNYQLRGEVCHGWVEVFLDDLGWVPFDPIWGETKSSKERKRRVSDMNRSYIYFSNIRNDPMLLNNAIHIYGFKGAGVDTEKSVIFRKPVIKTFRKKI